MGCGSSIYQNELGMFPETSWIPGEGGEYIDGKFHWEEGELNLFYRGIKYSKPRGILFVCHGLSVSSYHEGDYVSSLASAFPGLDIYGMDHVSHGLSEGELFMIPHYRIMVDSTKAFIHFILHHYDEGTRLAIPKFFSGDSIGGAVAFFVGMELEHILNGVIFTSPALRIPNLPNACEICMIRCLAPCLPRCKAAPQRTDSITRDQLKLERLMQEPYKIHGPITFQSGVSFLNITLDIQDHFSEFSLPFLICHGLQDTYTDPEGSLQLYQESPVVDDDKKIHLYPNAFHDLFHEIDEVVDVVVADIKNWLQERLSRGKRSEYGTSPSSDRAFSWGSVPQSDYV